jgi:tetratricopeptide (TPR) repeat protein
MGRQGAFQQRREIEGDEEKTLKLFTTKANVYFDSGSRVGDSIDPKTRKKPWEVLNTRTQGELGSIFSTQESEMKEKPRYSRTMLIIAATFAACCVQTGCMTSGQHNLQVASALFNKGVTLGQQGDARGKLKTYDEVVSRFGQDSAPGVREAVAGALYNKGATLGQQGDVSAEIRTYDEVVKRFGQDSAPGVRGSVASALYNKGVTLGEQGDASGALKTYDEVVSRFGQDGAPVVREQVAKALFYKGVTLGRQGDARGEIEIYDEIIKRFEKDSAPGVRELVASAHNAIGYSLANSGQRLDEAEQHIARALEILPGDPDFLDSMGWVRFRRGDLAGALKWLEEAYTLKQTHAEIAAHLGEVLWKLGRKAEARRILDGALAAHPDDADLRKTIHRLYPKSKTRKKH